MTEWTKQEYEVAMQQRDELFPGFAEEQEEEGEEIKVVDAKIEELVEGDIKLKEDESLPKDVPIKKKKKVK